MTVLPNIHSISLPEAYLHIQFWEGIISDVQQSTVPHLFVPLCHRGLDSNFLNVGGSRIFRDVVETPGGMPWDRRSLLVIRHLSLE